MPILGADELPLSGLGQLGAVGVILSILFWFSWQVYKRERDRADANAVEVARLNEQMQSKTIPALTEATRALAEANELLIRLSESRRSR